MVNKNERGNVIWFLLLAVALLGMLTLILTRSGSTVDQAGDVEQRRIKATELLRYGKSIQAAVEQMITRGVSENDLSFQNPTTAFDYTNANCTTTDCKVFDAGGAGLTYKNFPDSNDGSDWIFTGANNVGTANKPVGTTEDTTGNDLIMLLPNVKEALCEQINRDLPIGAAIPTDTGINRTEFVGTFLAGTPVILDGDPTPFELDAQDAGCFTDTSNNVEYFYYVILAR